MTRISAGIMLWRRRSGALEVLLAHPGGPLFVARDLGHWGVPKGQVEQGELLLDVARREFAEETGHAAPLGPLLELGSIVQKGGKVVHVWAGEGDLDPAAATSNTFPLEWPPHSGRIREFPEIDRVAWFGLEEAARQLRPTQVPLLNRLVAALGVGP
jgi:predicted NUDIX family NTP pyrophosphohydrolase